MKKYHYVYRITNTNENKHYIGVRSSIINPYDDLGIKYFSSSSDKNFINEQKENRHFFTYQIIDIFKTRKEAISLEIFLHNKYNVAQSIEFYNKAKQTSCGFDTSGSKYSDERKKTISERMKLSNPFKGKTHSPETLALIKEKNSEIVECPHCGMKGFKNLMKQWHFNHCIHHIDVEKRNINIEYMKGVSERKSGENNPMFGRHGEDNKKSFKYELYDSYGILIDTCYGAEIKDILKRNSCPCSFRYMKGSYNYTGNSPIRYKEKQGWYLETIKDRGKYEN